MPLHLTFCWPTQAQTALHSRFNRLLKSNGRTPGYTWQICSMSLRQKRQRRTKVSLPLGSATPGKTSDHQSTTQVPAAVTSRETQALVTNQDCNKHSSGALGANAAMEVQGQQRQILMGANFVVPGLSMTDYTVKVPLDHIGQVPGQISVFYREVVALNKVQQQQPYLLYLQGGPGFEAPRPPEPNTWLKSAVANFRVILMDQRGTGRSTAITPASLEKRGVPEQQAEYLSFFRADSIVADAEIIRKIVVPADQLGGRWSVLGQSFGGFCAVHYLSKSPHGLTEVMLTGGLPPGIADACPADSLYRALLRRVLEQNRKYYLRFPGDVALVQGVVRYLLQLPEGGLRLPNGTLLTPRNVKTSWVLRMLHGETFPAWAMALSVAHPECAAMDYMPDANLLGLPGLGGGGGFEALHFLLERAWDGDELSPAFIKGWGAWMVWDTNPLYAVLHESIYCQQSASNWSAWRVLQEEFAADFDAAGALEANKPVMFTGEMVFPWMFEEFAALKGMAAAAELLARKADWPRLYDADALAAVRVPVAAAVYYEDMYVDHALSMETAARIHGIRPWVTSEYRHSGIRDDGGRIFDHLLGLLRGSIPLC